jgi:hypothetical protein
MYTCLQLNFNWLNFNKSITTTKRQARKEGRKEGRKELSKEGRKWVERVERMD